MADYTGSQGSKSPSAWGAAGFGMAGQLPNLYQHFAGRRIRRMEGKLAKERWGHRYNSANRAIAAFQDLHPYEMGGLKGQLAAGRGFGKSDDPMDVGNRAVRRLSNHQARQMAAAYEAQREAGLGLSLIRKKLAHQKRFQWVPYANMALQGAMQGVGGMNSMAQLGIL